MSYKNSGIIGTEKGRQFYLICVIMTILYMIQNTIKFTLYLVKKMTTRRLL